MMLEKESRRGFVTKSILIPAIVATVPTFIGYYLTRRDLQQHQLDSTIYYSNNGTEDAYPVGLETLLTGGLSQPSATPGVPATEHTYISIVRNTGDYSEENISILISYLAIDGSTGPLGNFTLEASSVLLEQDIEVVELSNQPRVFEITIPRMNPGESMSHASTWSTTVEVAIEVRSYEVSSKAGRD